MSKTSSSCYEEMGGGSDRSRQSPRQHHQHSFQATAAAAVSVVCQRQHEVKNSSGYTEFGSFHESRSSRTLGTFAGVFSPVALSMFSALLFLRVGFVVGNAGLLETILQFFIAYSIIFCTVTSVCAVSTNGEVEGGGAYFMISRILGPEFGGSIGTLFFFANIVSSALYTVGFSEGLVNNFGPNGYLVGKGKSLLSTGRWWSFFYASVLNSLNFLICLVGAELFAKTTVFVFIIVTACVSSSFFSFTVMPAKNITIPDANTLLPKNSTELYTSFSMETFRENFHSNYSVDYTSNGMQVTFASVFGVLFSGVTGILAGANMSGELKHPGRSIPSGTISAVIFTMGVYLVLSILSAATCHRSLLQNNYLYLMPINIWPPFITVGILTATFSASLSNLIGSSRVLEALAKDNIFGTYLNVVTYGTWKSNPIAAVMVSWCLVQVMLIIGSLNIIAQINSILFLLSYLALNAACLGLELASAPNFRPSFSYFSWHTSAVGLIGSFTMMFVINPFYASSSIGLCLLIVLLLHFFSPARTASWGSISQALIFHQVRKYLLLLDTRKDHVKFWRPQILLMVSNPRVESSLIDFVNDLKKSGLYVLGHVKVTEQFLDLENDPAAEEYINWLSFVDLLKVKAFVELTVAQSVREGLSHLIRISGMGAMKPNTIIFGFYDELPNDSLSPVSLLSSSSSKDMFLKSSNSGQEGHLFSPSNRNGGGGTNKISAEEYLHMVDDVLRMRKNVCICKHFAQFDKMKILKSVEMKYIDVWPINFFNPTVNDIFDTTGLFMLQLSCIITMVQDWKKFRLRVHVYDFFEGNGGGEDTEENTDSCIYKFKTLLSSLRISADVCKVKDWPKEVPFGLNNGDLLSEVVPYFKLINELVLHECRNTAIIFLYLPPPFVSVDGQRSIYFNSANNYLRCLSEITKTCPPTILVHGISSVISTAL